MMITLLLLYLAFFIGLWYFLKYTLKGLLKDKYKPSYLITAFLVLLPFAIIALGFLAMLLLPMETPD
ncbi:hypothetical protein ACTJJ0_19855 [Chitinophaga sp. 22321]|uniref:Phospholipase_D-nuclease N-terminal n=1 Tax=Chitinophaga hostae TaxID=2831022 RepID=A0ABS5IXA9_9BACT|nr:hypothetical protein [Chitinophaga hostae]MBS0027505.1 hypothetical protein [Chitinophaga hostae]